MDSSLLQILYLCSRLIGVCGLLREGYPVPVKTLAASLASAHQMPITSHSLLPSAVTSSRVFRHCQEFPSEKNFLWLRTTGLDNLSSFLDCIITWRGRVNITLGHDSGYILSVPCGCELLIFFFFLLSEWRRIHSPDQQPHTNCPRLLSVLAREPHLAQQLQLLLLGYVYITVLLSPVIHLVFFQRQTDEFNGYTRGTVALICSKSLTWYCSCCSAQDMMLLLIYYLGWEWEAVSMAFAWMSDVYDSA